MTAPTPGAVLDAETETVARYIAAGAADVLGLGDRVTGAGGWTGTNWQKFVPQAKRLLARLARPTPAGENRWDDRCRDCDDTGITIQTERVCACQPTPPAQPEPGAGELEVVAWLVWDRDDGIMPATRSFNELSSWKHNDGLVRQSQAQAKIARLEGEVARLKEAELIDAQGISEINREAVSWINRALSAEAEAAKVREALKTAARRLGQIADIGPVDRALTEDWAMEASYAAGPVRVA